MKQSMTIRRLNRWISLFFAVVMIVLPVASLSVEAASSLTITAKYQKGKLGAGESFTVTVFPEDPIQMASVALCGVEYSFSYDPALFSADTADLIPNPAFVRAYDWNMSYVAYSVADGNVKFASHLKLFDSETGYTSSLTEFFSVTLTAKSDIEEISDCFSVSPTVKAVSSSGSELAVTNKTVIFTNTHISDLIPADSFYLYASNPQVGSASYPLPSVTYFGGANITCGEILSAIVSDSPDLQIAISNGTNEIGSSERVCSGYLLNLYEFGILKQSAVILLRGDGNCDGTVDVYDVIGLLRYVVGDSVLETVARLAFKNVQNSSDANVYDVVGIMRFITNLSW